MARRLPSLAIIMLLSSCSAPAENEQPKEPAARQSVEPAHETCLLHNLPMEVESVSVIYGQRVEDETVREARMKYFPNARMAAFSDEVGPGVTSALIRFCPTCRDARDRWLMQNQNRLAPRQEGN